MNGEQGIDEPWDNDPAKPSNAQVAASAPPTPISAPPPSVAPRPHVVTILLGLMSPAAAIAAIYISAQGLATSQRSLETSQTSMRVAQRAYLALRMGTVRRQQPTAVDTLRFPDGRLQRFEWTFEIHNLGNTPASEIEYGLHLRLPNSWKLKAIDDLEPTSVAGWSPSLRAANIAQDSSSRRSHVAIVEIPRGARQVWQFEDKLELNGILRYRDVFNGPQEFRWCWHEFMTNELPYLAGTERGIAQDPQALFLAGTRSHTAKECS